MGICGCVAIFQLSSCAHSGRTCTFSYKFRFMYVHTTEDVAYNTILEKYKARPSCLSHHPLALLLSTRKDTSHAPIANSQSQCCGETSIGNKDKTRRVEKT